MISPSDFADLFDEYFPKLYAYVSSQVSGQATAEDITATAFERALRSSHTYDPQKASFATWLFRIARNLVIDHYAATSRSPTQDTLDSAWHITTDTPSPEQQVMRQEQAQMLHQTMAHLSERDQEIIYLRFFGQLTNREIAGLLELKEKTVSVIILRALRKMKGQFEKQGSL